jgi:hypothetical protein
MQLIMIALSLKLQNDMELLPVMFQQVFEKALHTFDKALEDSWGKYQHQFWHSLVIRTNVAGDLMFSVFVHCPQNLAAGRMKHLNMELKEFFENGEGRKCGVVSVYTKVKYTYVYLKNCHLSGFIQTVQTVKVTCRLCLLFIGFSYFIY